MKKIRALPKNINGNKKGNGVKILTLNKLLTCEVVIYNENLKILKIIIICNQQVLFPINYINIKIQYNKMKKLMKPKTSAIPYFL